MFLEEQQLRILSSTDLHLPAGSEDRHSADSIFRGEQMEIQEGWLTAARHVISPHCDIRPADTVPRLLVIHNISLPPGQFGGPYIDQLFQGKLDPGAHPFFAEIRALRVSAHCLIRRTGEIVQYVPFHKRAWHAGLSCYQGTEKCNDFSVGIELEGTDTQAFTDEQYQVLAQVTQTLLSDYPQMKGHITGHSDIAPGRKTDPGPYFDWNRYRKSLAQTDTPVTLPVK